MPGQLGAAVNVNSRVSERYRVANQSLSEKKQKTVWKQAENKKKFVQKHDPNLDVSRRKEKASAYLRKLRQAPKENKYDRYHGLQFQMATEVMQASETVMGTTTDMSDNLHTRAEQIMLSDMTATMTPVATSGYNQEIRDFLAKPIIYDRFQIPISGQMDRVDIDLEDALYDFDVWYDKIKGYFGIKGTFVVRVQINAQPFQCGRILTVFQPMYKDMLYADGTSSAFNRTSNLITATQLPRVELDIASQTQSEMRVPYKTLSSFYNMATGEGSWGRISIMQYLNLNQGDSPVPIDATIWLSLEDVEFAAPTIPLVPQMADDDEKGSGPIEKIFSTVNSISSVFEDIPYVKVVAKPLTWVSNISSKVCSIFGWSKPQNTEQICRLNTTLMQYNANCDGMDNAFNLGLMAENSIQMQPEFGGTYVDESSLAYVKSRYAYLETIKWNASDPTGKQIMDLNMIPFNMKTNVGSTYYVTPVAGLADLFYYYSGGFVIKFKFAKTVYHSGRLILAFIPGYKNNFAGVPNETFTCDINKTVYLHRQVMDIRDQHEFEFTIPYTATVPYLDVESPIGKIAIYVQNSLVAPTTAAQSIDFAVEIRGAQDLEFCFPKAPLLYPKGPTLHSLKVQSDTSYTDSSFWPFLAKTEKVSQIRITKVETTTFDFAAMTTNAKIGIDGTGVPVLTYILGENFAIEATDILQYVPFKPTFATVDQMKVFVDGLDGKNALYSAEHDKETYYFCISSLYTYKRGYKQYMMFSLKTDDFEFQMDTGVNPVQPIGASATPASMGVEKAKYCIGEQILSLKQLALRNDLYNMSSTISVDNTETKTRRMPLSRLSLNFAGTNTSDQKALIDYYSYVCSLFAYVRGGVNVKFHNDGDDTVANIVYIQHDDTRFLDVASRPKPKFVGYAIERPDNLCSVYIPQYSRTIGRLVTVPRGNDIGARAPFGQTSSVFYKSLGEDGENSTSQVRIMRGAADDTQFGFFLGFPPMTVLPEPN